MQLSNLIPGGPKNPLAALEKDLARQARDLEAETAKLAAAQAARQAHQDAGADDATLDADEREITLAARRVRRGEIARDALIARRAEMTSAARAELRRRLQSELIHAGIAHGQAASRASESAQAYLKACDAMSSSGFARELTEFPNLPTMVVSLEGSANAGFAGSAPHAALNAFIYRVAALHASSGAS